LKTEICKGGGENYMLFRVRHLKYQQEDKIFQQSPWRTRTEKGWFERASLWNSCRERRQGLGRERKKNRTKALAFSQKIINALGWVAFAEKWLF